MDNEFPDSVADKLVELSKRLNNYAGEYQEQTLIIQKLLASGHEDSLFKIEDILNHRETLIKSYDQAARQLVREQAIFTDARVISAEVSQKLSSLERERQAIFSNIKDIEDKILKKVTDLYNENRGHIKHIEEGKKLMNAYQSGPQVNDGLFFDRRK